jgi:protein-tyrosine-phosphatase/DNA-binding transcriptional ArsR family regulator
MDTDLDLEVPELLRAAGDPLRWRILELLCIEDLCVCHLVDALGLAQSSVSHHLAILRSAGLVETERFRYWTYYRLSASALAGMAHHLGALADAAASPDRRRRPAVAGDVPDVLFVCVSNAGRSLMASALLDHYAGGRVHVRSAGSLPAEHVHAAVLAAMREVGIDLDQAYPERLTDEVVEAADVVVTMGCGDACVVHPGTRYLDWPVGDPAGQSLATVRAIRDDIAGRVQTLLGELLPGPAGKVRDGR